MSRKGNTYPADLYERDDVARLLRECGRSRTGLRNQALIGLLAGAGLRLAEALAVEPRDVNFTDGSIRVRRGKGAKPRTVTLDATTAALLSQWIVGGRPPDARTLICTVTTGHRLQPSYVAAMLHRTAERAGITKRIHPHGLRHFYACELDRAGYPLAQISVLLGHKSTVTTAIYLERLRGVDPTTASRLREREWLPVPAPTLRASRVGGRSD